MKKHTLTQKSGGFHQAKIVPFEVVGYGFGLLTWPVTHYIIYALTLPIAGLYLYFGLRNLMRQIPTVLGYGDYAVTNTKKSAVKVAKNTKPAPKAQLLTAAAK